MNPLIKLGYDYLEAPAYFWLMDEKELYGDPATGKEGLCNGCGSKCTSRFIPDYLWGLWIDPACQIHDVSYTFLSGAQKLSVPRSEEDKAKIDTMFKNNMLRIIARNPNWFLDRLRKGAALGYYEAVHNFGGASYWDTAAAQADQLNPAQLSLLKAVDARRPSKLTAPSGMRFGAGQDDGQLATFQLARIAKEDPTRFSAEIMKIFSEESHAG